VRNVLFLSGDHQSFGDHPGAKNVHDIDSIQMLAMLRAMRDEGRFQSGGEIAEGGPQFFIGAAENPFADPAAMRPYRLRKKAAAGAQFIQTQLIYDLARFREFMKKAVDLGVQCFINNGWQAPISLGVVQETTRFAEFGPLSGSTFYLGAAVAPGFGSFLQRQTVNADLRKYLRLGSTSALLALRGRGFYSTGDNPDYFYFGGNMELRGYPYYGFAGNQGFFANAELRFPLIHLAATPIGILGPVRGTIFFGIGGAKFKGEPYTFATSEPGFSYINDRAVGEPVSGWHLVSGRASYGFGLELFFLGYPMHFDWSKFTDFGATSNSWKFSFWIGYDF